MTWVGAGMTWVGVGMTGVGAGMTWEGVGMDVGGCGNDSGGSCVREIVVALGESLDKVALVLPCALWEVGGYAAPFGLLARMYRQGAFIRGSHGFPPSRE